MLKVTTRAFVMTFIVIAAILVSPTISKAPKTQEAFKEASIIVAKNPGDVSVKIVAKSDDRSVRLARFLRSKGSPMTASADELVEIADKYKIDWKFLPAIAGLESQFGKMVPSGSYNPYGWDNGRYRFQSWAQASEIVAAGIRTRYAPYGEVTPWRIGSMYAESKTWASRVSMFMNHIAAY